MSSDIENVGQSHHLQNLLYLSFYITDFYKSFIEMMAMWLAQKCHISWPWKCWPRSPFTNIIMSRLLWPILTNLSLKWCNWGRLQNRHISWPLKCRSTSHFINSNISAIYTQFSSRMMTKLLHSCVQVLISLPKITVSSTWMHHPQTSHLFAVHRSSSDSVSTNLAWTLLNRKCTSGARPTVASGGLRSQGLCHLGC